MKTVKIFIIGILLTFLVSSFKMEMTPWGFYGHRKINRMAVYTLPPEMLVFYKKHIEYITEHSIDPDKRRYSTEHEAVRHYIDIDYWGQYPFEDVPRDLSDALILYSDISLVQGADTLIKFDHMESFLEDGLLKSPNTDCQIDYSYLQDIFAENVLPNYYESNWLISVEDPRAIAACGDFREPLEWYIKDQFSSKGVLPYHLYDTYFSLINAFLGSDVKRILRLSAEIGHYISDGHVPLHTTENYNGQLTDQIGIHAFWESRIPELFADEEYDFFVGQAEYIADPKTFFWDFILDSHILLDSVLLIEKRLSKEYPSDAQYCFEERFERTVRVPCTDYSFLYQESMGGMVEERMRAAIRAVASVWYSAWVDAGQPDMEKLLDEVNWSKEELDLQKEQERLLQGGKVLGRDHSNE